VPHKDTQHSSALTSTAPHTEDTEEQHRLQEQLVPYLQSLDLAVATDGIDRLALLQSLLLLPELRQPLHQTPLSFCLVALLLPEPRVFLTLLQKNVIPRLGMTHHYARQKQAGCYKPLIFYAIVLGAARV